MGFMQLSDVCAINMGQSPDSSSYNDVGNGLPFFQGNADFGDKYPITRVWCSEPTKIAHAEDILISVRAPIGAMNYAKDTCCIGRGLAAITPDKARVSPEFIFWLLKGKNAELNSKGTGSTFKAISRKVLEEVSVPDISLAQQTAYATHLEAVYGIIQTRQRELRTLDTLIKARFVEMFGEPIANTRRLSTRALRDVLVLKAGDFTAASDIADNPDATYKYPCYGGNGIRGYVEAYSQEGEYSLIGRQGALSGNVQFAKGKFKNTEHALLVTPLIEMNNTWLNQLLINLDLKRYQTGAAQPGLSVKNLQDIPIIVVPIGEQEQFAAFVSQVDKSKVAVQAALNKDQLLFDSLMQQYFG